MEGERRKDAGRRDRLDEIQDEYRALAKRNLDAINEARGKTKRLLTVVSVALLALGGWSVWFQVQQSNTAIQASHAATQAASAARKAGAAARAASGFAAAIQASRLDLIRSQCDDQNRRHDAAVRALNKAAARSPRQPGQTSAQRRQGVAAFLLILNAQTPHKKCDRVVAAARLGGGG
jgi:predicted negative regulator of RcsB-dependent stress response